jgi:hypothetical protein
MNKCYQVAFYCDALEDRVSQDQCMPVLAHFSAEKEASAYIDELPKDAVHDLAMALLIDGCVEMEFNLGESN